MKVQKVQTSRRAALAQPAFTLTLHSNGEVDLHTTPWLSRMLRKFDRPLVDACRWIREQAERNFTDGYFDRDKSDGKPIRKGRLKDIESKLVAKANTLERTKKWRSARRPVASITRTKRGKQMMRYTARDGSVKQVIVGDDTHSIAPRPWPDKVLSNVVYDHRQFVKRVPFTVEQNLGYHLAKIGYC